MEDFFNRTGHQQQTLIQMCTWKTGACSDSSWTTEYTHYGKCYTFNRNGDHVLKKAGAGRLVPKMNSFSIKKERGDESIIQG